MKAVYQGELNAYFKSPTGYVFCAIYLFFSAMYFSSVLSAGQSSEFPQIYYGMLSFILLMLPLLTMRLFSEERKYKTDQVLLTAPVNLTPLVMGKFLSALTVYVGCLLFTLIYAAVFRFFVSPSWPLVVGNIFGATLFGAAFLAVGMFISSMTESQFVAAMGSFSIATVFVILDVIPLRTSNAFIVKLINDISFVGRYTPFKNGILDFSSIVFFLSITATFIFLTVRVLEKRRWS